MRLQFALIAATIFSSMAMAAEDNEEDIRDYVITYNPKDDVEMHDLGTEQVLVDTVPPETTVQKGQKKLKSLFDGMKAFVSMPGLDFEEFMPQQEAMKSFISDVIWLTDKEENFWEIAGQIQFVEEFLKTMSTASEILKKFDDYSITGGEFLCDVTNTLVSAMSLNDIQGDLDLAVPDFRDKVSYFKSYIVSSEEKFNSLKDVSPEIRSLFEGQVTKAKETIGYLEKNISFLA